MVDAVAGVRRRPGPAGRVGRERARMPSETATPGIDFGEIRPAFLPLLGAGHDPIRRHGNWAWIGSQPRTACDRGV